MKECVRNCRRNRMTMDMLKETRTRVKDALAGMRAEKRGPLRTGVPLYRQ
jgi:hypothetical protein